jgi:hypothetical protein
MALALVPVQCRKNSQVVSTHLTYSILAIWVECERRNRGRPKENLEEGIELNQREEQNKYDEFARGRSPSPACIMAIETRGFPDLLRLSPLIGSEAVVIWMPHGSCKSSVQCLFLIFNPFGQVTPSIPTSFPRLKGMIVSLSSTVVVYRASSMRALRYLRYWYAHIIMSSCSWLLGAPSASPCSPQLLFCAWAPSQFQWPQ